MTSHAKPIGFPSNCFFWPLVFVGFFLTHSNLIHASSDDDLIIDDIFSLSLEDLLQLSVTVASKTPEAIIDAPSIVSALSREQILAYGAKNLGELVDQLPAVYRGNLFSLHDAYVSVRGQERDGLDSRTLITLNGRPMREYWTGGMNQPIYRGMPIDAIERIEMIRGPGSVIYGSGAFSDVLNIVTRDPDVAQNSLRLTGGSFDTKIGEFTGSYTNGSTKGLTSVKADHVGGWDYKATDSTGTYDEQKNGWDNISLVSSWSTDSAGVDVFYSDINTDSIGASTLWPGTETSTERAFLNTYYAQDISSHWNLRGDFTANATRVDNEDDLLLKQEVRTHNFIYELTAAGNYTDWDFLGGASVSQLFGHDKTSTVFSGEDDNSGNTTWYNAYFQGDYRATEQLKVVVGAQVNKPENIDANVSPRLGLIYQFDNNWGMKLLYGEAFRTASWTDTDTNLPPVFVGNSDIEPEEIATTDLQLFYRSKDVYAAMTVFYSSITNTYVTANGTVDNGGETEFTGGEFEWQWHVSNAWSYEGSVALQSNEDENGNKDTRLSPEWLVKQGVTYQSGNRWRIGIFDNYVSKIDNPGAPKLNPSSQAVHILTLNGRYDISDWVDNGKQHAVQFTVNNALESDPIHQPDSFLKKGVNTLPWRSERGFYLTYLGEF